MTLIAMVTNVLVVHPSLPVKSVKELIALAKARPGQLNFASGGSGGTQHLSGELFKTMAGIDMVHIPYKGSSAAMPDVLGGFVSLIFDGLPQSLPYIKAGRLRALGVTTASDLRRYQMCPLSRSPAYRAMRRLPGSVSLPPPVRPKRS